MCRFLWARLRQKPLSCFMFKSLKDDIVRNYHMGNMVTRLVIVNVAVFVIFVLLRVIFAGFENNLFDRIVQFFSLSSNWKHLVIHPWVFVSATFLHLGFMHLLFNMIGLYVFGQIVGDLIGDRHILPIYILGGAFAGLMFFFSAMLLPYGQIGPQFALGASGGVMAIAAASAMIAPDYEIKLLLIGRVKLKYIVAVLLLIDVASLGGNMNTGGHFGHIGGFLFGFLYIYSIRNGQDIGAPFNKAVNNIRNLFSPAKRKNESRERRSYGAQKRKSAPHLTVVKTVRANKNKKKQVLKVEEMDNQTFQEHLDMILDKIKESGYDSLNKDEKEFLFKASNR